MTEPAYTEQDLQRAKSFVIGAGGVEICLCPDENCRPRFEGELATEFSRIRSEAVAGAVKACANVITAYSTLGGWLDSPKEVERAIHSLTPAEAAAEIGRIKAEAEKMTLQCVHVQIACPYCGAGEECWILNRIAALSGKEPSHD